MARRAGAARSAARGRLSQASSARSRRNESASSAAAKAFSTWVVYVFHFKVNAIRQAWMTPIPRSFQREVAMLKPLGHEMSYLS